MVSTLSSKIPRFWQPRSLFLKAIVHGHQVILMFIGSQMACFFSPSRNLCCHIWWQAKNWGQINCWRKTPKFISDQILTVCLVWDRSGFLHSTQMSNHTLRTLWTIACAVGSGWSIASSDCHFRGPVGRTLAWERDLRWRKLSVAWFISSISLMKLSFRHGDGSVTTQPSGRAEKHSMGFIILSALRTQSPAQ